MKEKRIFTTTIVVQEKKNVEGIKDILKKEGISFFEESGIFDFTDLKCNLNWIEVKRLIKLGVINLENNELNLRTYC